MSGPIEIQKQVASLQTDAIVHFFILDATNIGAPTLYFYAVQNNTDSGPITWQSIEYTPIPVELRGFEIRGTGTQPRPSIRFANLDALMTAFVLAYSDLVGAKLTRKSTMSRFLDGQPNADPTAEYPNQVFYIARKIEENRDSIEFELRNAMDIGDATLPKRIISSAGCQWKYRSAECSFAGDYPVATAIGELAPLADLVDRGEYNPATEYFVNDFVYLTYPYGLFYYWCINDNSGAGITGIRPPNTTYWKGDECSHSTNGCTLRFPTGILPFGGFPGTSVQPFAT